MIQPAASPDSALHHIWQYLVITSAAASPDSASHRFWTRVIDPMLLLSTILSIHSRLTALVHEPDQFHFSVTFPDSQTAHQHLPENLAQALARLPPLQSLDYYGCQRHQMDSPALPPVPNLPMVNLFLFLVIYIQKVFIYFLNYSPFLLFLHCPYIQTLLF